MIAAPATPAIAHAVVGAPLPAPARLQVSEREFRLGLSRTRVKRGAVEIEIVNFGQDPHDLVVQRRGKGGSAVGKPVAAAAVAPGGRGELATRLAPGRYTLYCSLPGHRGRGMVATLVVR